jgi:ribosomal protein S18 acetylase RimI-like enzyme
MMRTEQPKIRAVDGTETARAVDDFRGGTFRLPPGVLPDGDAIETLFRETVAEPTRSASIAVVEQMEASHPKEPFWHLAFIGVDPARQGRGIGAGLLRHTLARVDAAGVQAYLESSNPANVSLYRRHGFDVTREIRVSGSPVTLMLRAPR